VAVGSGDIVLRRHRTDGIQTDKPMLRRVMYARIRSDTGDEDKAITNIVLKVERRFGSRPRILGQPAVNITASLLGFASKSKGFGAMTVDDQFDSLLDELLGLSVSVSLRGFPKASLNSLVYGTVDQPP